jgi:hypothetical protein
VHGHHNGELRQRTNINNLLQQHQRPDAEHRRGALLRAADRRRRQRSNADRRQRHGQQTGTIDPPRSVLASPGLVIGNTVQNSAIVVNNNASGQIKGVVNIGSILGFGGQALVVQNASGGVSNIVNAGDHMSIFGAGLLTDRCGIDRATVVRRPPQQHRHHYRPHRVPGFGHGGGRQYLPQCGNHQRQREPGCSVAGNTFTAVSGSSVNTAGIGVGVGRRAAVNLAAAGIVDGGSAANNTLVLQNSATGPGSGTGGAVTTLGWNQYLNFQRLTVNSGTWNLQGAWAGAGTTTLNDGLVNFNNAGSFGTGLFTANGGAIAASTAGLNLANAFSLGGNLSLAGTNAFSLGGVLSGTGGLTVNNTGIVTWRRKPVLRRRQPQCRRPGAGQCRCAGQRQPDRGWQRFAGYDGGLHPGQQSGDQWRGSLNLLGSNALSLNGSIPVPAT